jgi:hypothetical protein
MTPLQSFEDLGGAALLRLVVGPRDPKIAIQMKASRRGECIWNVHVILWCVLENEDTHVPAVQNLQKAIQPARKYNRIVELEFIVRAFRVGEPDGVMIFRVRNPVAGQYDCADVIASYPVQNRLGMPLAILTSTQAERIQPGMKEAGLLGESVADVHVQ